MTLAQTIQNLVHIKGILEIRLNSTKKVLEVNPDDQQSLFTLGHYEKQVEAMQNACTILRNMVL